MPNSNAAFARIYTRPLSYDEKELAVPKELIADYKNRKLYICDIDGNIIEASASIEDVTNAVINQISDKPETITKIELTLESGETITIEDSIKSIESLKTALKLTSTIEDIQVAVLGGVDNWTQHGSGSTKFYSQIVSAKGIKSTDFPVVDISTNVSYFHYNTNNPCASKQLDEYSKIYKITTGEDHIRIYASSYTNIDLTLNLKVNRLMEVN